VLTGAVFFVVIARLLVLAKFDAVTARAILANAGPTQVILGTLVTSLPWVLVIIAIGLPILFRMEGRGTGTPATRRRVQLAGSGDRPRWAISAPR
jgi:hypothetical protein